MTNILGKDKEGPVNNKANAGPFPIPETNKPGIMGTFGESGKIHEHIHKACKEI